MRPNSEFRRLMREISGLLVLTGANRFRANAYSRAARVVSDENDPIAPRAIDGTIVEVDGIGEGIASELEVFARTGVSPLRESLRAQVPDGVIELLGIRGLGASKVRRLWQDHGIGSVEALERAAIDGSLAALPGFGAKTVTKLSTEILRVRALRGRMPYARAVELAAQWRGVLVEAGVGAVRETGGLARGDELMSEAELLALRDDALRSWAEANGHDASGGSVVPASGVRIWLAEPDAWEAELWARSSSAAHVEAVAARARARSLVSVGTSAAETARALLEERGDARGAYQALGLPYLRAPMRVGDDALAAADEGWLGDTIETADLRGDLHMHTTWSDGAASVAEMAAAATARGLRYIAITDHSGSLAIANGLDAERLLAQMAEIDAFNASAPDGSVRVLKGLEVDILADGTLDMDASVLRQLDWVVGSVHTRFEMASDEMTARVTAAVESGLVHAIGHPTGRKIGVRSGVALSLDRVIDACAANGVALELNASPYRLDLGEDALRAVLRRPDVWLTLNTDAHAPRELGNARHGVRTAQRAWVPSERVLNCLPLDAFVEEVAR